MNYVNSPFTGLSSLISVNIFQKMQDEKHDLLCMFRVLLIIYQDSDLYALLEHNYSCSV